MPWRSENTSAARALVQLCSFFSSWPMKPWPCHFLPFCQDHEQRLLRNKIRNVTVMQQHHNTMDDDKGCCVDCWGHFLSKCLQSSQEDDKQATEWHFFGRQHRYERTKPERIVDDDESGDTGCWERHCRWWVVIVGSVIVGGTTRDHVQTWSWNGGTKWASRARSRPSEISSALQWAYF